MPNIYPAIDPLPSLATLGDCCYIRQPLQTLCQIWTFQLYRESSTAKEIISNFWKYMFYNIRRQVDRQVYNLHVNTTFTVSFQWSSTFGV